MTIAEALILIAPHIADLVKVLVEPYDAEAERQALFKLQRSVADARVKKLLEG